MDGVTRSTKTDLTSWFLFEFSLLLDGPWEWIIVTGNRLLISLFQLVLLAGTLLVVMLLGFIPLQAETPILFLLFALITANFTLISIITSLSQFLLGREVESPNEIRAEMAETISYREDISKTISQSVMPVKPAIFFLFLFANVRDDLESLEQLSSQARTKRAQDELEDLIAGFQTHTDQVVEHLEHPASELKHALFTSVNADYENYAHQAWYLQMEHSDEFTDPVTEQLDQLTDKLEYIVVATRMFQTTFIKSEVAELSRFLLYIGLPVQLSSVIVMLLYTAPASVPLVSSATLTVLIPAVLIAGFVPFLLLSSYIVRLTIIAQRMADRFPFNSQHSDTVVRSNTGTDDP
ncbi:hypothetical protein [Halalkalicoccus salilacus]|uniref:hypothetical protein n=1 Tax=Halalkalicoccus salilacus TaxID=3117459 RepID=UPI00300F4C65